MSSGNPPKGSKKSFSRAKSYVDNPEKTAKLLERARRKAQKNKGSISKVWDGLTSLFRLIGAWMTGKYKSVPTKTILLALGAVVYFVSPVDLIPDFLVGIGYIDDAGVIGWVLKSISADLKLFREWEDDDSEGAVDTLVSPSL